jgi:hypothetical protein
LGTHQSKQQIELKNTIILSVSFLKFTSAYRSLPKTANKLTEDKRESLESSLALDASGSSTGERSMMQRKRVWPEHHYCVFVPWHQNDAIIRFIGRR